MNNEVPENQKAVIVGAVLLAAVLSGGLWYFFVFREPSIDVTPTPDPLAGIPQPTPDDDFLFEPTPDEFEHVAPTEPTPAPDPTGIAGVQHVPASSQTGAGGVALLSILAASVGGLLGLRKFSR